MPPLTTTRASRSRSLPVHQPVPSSVRWIRLFGFLVPMTVLAVFFFLPVLAMIGRGLVPSAWETFAQARTWRLAATSVGLAGAGTVVSVVLGTPAAYALYVVDFPGRRLVRAVLTMPFVLPTVVVGTAFSTLLRKDGPYGFLGLDGTWGGVLAAMVFFNLSVIVRTVGPFWASLDPRLFDAARMLGASPWRRWWTLTLPLLRPAVTSGATLVFLFCSTAYGIVMTLGGASTLESEIWSQSIRLNYDRAAALSLLQCVFVALALVLSTRISAPRLRLHTQPVRRRTRTDVLAVLYTAILTITVIVAPLASLVIRSFHVDGAWSVEAYEALAAPGAGFAGGVSVLHALLTSLGTAALASACALLIGVPLAMALSHPNPSPSQRRVQRLGEALAMAPLGVSAVTLGFGYLLVMVTGPVYLGVWAVPLAQAIVVLPLVLQSLLPVLRAIHPRLRDASAMLGASPARTWLHLEVPLIRRSLAHALGFALAMSLGEFGAASFLSTGDRMTLPVLISRLLGRPGGINYDMALAASVILGVVTMLVMALADLVGDSRRATFARFSPTTQPERVSVSGRKSA